MTATSFIKSMASLFILGCSAIMINAQNAPSEKPKAKTPKEKILYAPPYLQNPSPTGMTIMFQTTVPAHCWVEFGTDSTQLHRRRTLVGGQVVCHSLDNKIRLDSLKPGTRYYYRVCANEILVNKAYHKEFGDTAVTRFYSFRTPNTTDENFTAIVFNDLHARQTVLDSLYAQVKHLPYDFVAFNGDCLPEPATHADAIKQINDIAKTVNGAEHPIFFIRGNHEIRNAYSSGMLALLDFPNDKTYFAFNWGDTRFVVLDCGEDKPDDTWVYYGLNDFTGFRQEQVPFLKSELKSNAFRKAKKHVLLSHIPIYGNCDKYSPCTSLFGNVLHRAPFDIYLAAHTHEQAFHEKGSVGNPFPVSIGGGPNLKSGVVMVLNKKGKTLHFHVINARGKAIVSRDY